MRIRLSQLRQIIKEEVQRTLSEGLGEPSPRAQYLPYINWDVPATTEEEYLLRHARLASKDILEDEMGYSGMTNAEAADEWLKWEGKKDPHTKLYDPKALAAAIVADLAAVNRQKDFTGEDGDDRLAPKRTGWENY